MTSKRLTIDRPADAPIDERRPTRRSDGATNDRLTPQETVAWNDLPPNRLGRARCAQQPAPKPAAPDRQPRRVPALTPARRAVLAHEVVVARHRWPAAFSTLQNAREIFEAAVAADGRNVRVHCTAQAAAMLNVFATWTQP